MRLLSHTRKERYYFMSITQEAVRANLNDLGFFLKSSTVKLARFKSTVTGRSIYVYKQQGFPDHADVVVHPETNLAPLLAVPGIAINKRTPVRFGSNMTDFPMRINRGIKPEHYGKALYVFSESAISGLCSAYER